MTIDFNLVALLDLLAFVQGTLLGLLLMFKKKEHLSYFLLGLFLFTYSSELLVSVLADSGIFAQKPSWIYLPITFYFWFMPALFLYVKSLSGSLNWKKYGWLFLPGILEVIGIVILFFQPTAVKSSQWKSEWVDQFYMIYVSIAMVYSIGYAIFILNILRQHQNRVNDFFSNAKGKLLSWVRWICLLIIFINLVLFSGLFINEDYYISYIYPSISAFNVIFIFWIALSGFRQKAVDLPKIENENIPPPTKRDKDDDQQEFDKILAYLEKEKVYTQADLHLADLAQQLHLSQRHLSELINQKAGVNFNQLINQLRVEEAKKLLVDEKYAHLNILGIGFEVGFNSKTSFYTAFKKEVGKTPAKFQKQALNTTKAA